MRQTHQISAGFLMFRGIGSDIEVLLVHPGGPAWRTRWHGWWQIPKGAIDEGEDPLAAARREFYEETGHQADGIAIPLGCIRQAAGKRVFAFACKGDLEVAKLRSNTFSMEWPPRSGRFERFPEIDAARWFTPQEAAKAMLASQRPLLDRLARALVDPAAGAPGEGGS